MGCMPAQRSGRRAKRGAKRKRMTECIPVGGGLPAMASVQSTRGRFRKASPASRLPQPVGCIKTGNPHTQKRPGKPGRFVCGSAISCRGCGSAGPVFHREDGLAIDPVARPTGSGRSWTPCARSSAVADHRAGCELPVPAAREVRGLHEVLTDDGCAEPDHRESGVQSLRLRRYASVPRRRNLYVRHHRYDPGWLDALRHRPPVLRQALPPDDDRDSGLCPGTG